MEKAFKNFIKSTVNEFLSARGWTLAQPPKGCFIAGKGPLWKRVGTNGTCVFLFCFIHDNLNAVTMYVGWNRVNEFPSIDAAMDGRRTSVTCQPGRELEAAAVLVDAHEQGWLDQVALGHVEMFELSTKTPPMERLASVYDDPRNAQEIRVGLLGADYAHWRDATPFHYWGIVEHFDKLTNDDARIAVGGTCDNIIRVLKTHFLPLAQRRLGEK